MAGTFVVNGDQTTVTFTYAALTQKVLDTVTVTSMEFYYFTTHLGIELLDT